MNTQIFNPSVVDKERISGFLFSDQDVLTSSTEIKERKANAEIGLLLGNTYKCKVKIIFEDSESIKQVETTIWGLTDKHVILKKAITIPLHRIHNVEICSWIISI